MDCEEIVVDMRKPDSKEFALGRKMTELLFSKRVVKTTGFSR